jgi:hypothetical protein
VSKELAAVKVTSNAYSTLTMERVKALHGELSSALQRRVAVHQEDLATYQKNESICIEFASVANSVVKQINVFMSELLHPKVGSPLILA